MIFFKIFGEVKEVNEFIVKRVECVKYFLVDFKNELVIIDLLFFLFLDFLIEICGVVLEDIVVFKLLLYFIKVVFKIIFGWKYFILFKIGDDFC